MSFIELSLNTGSKVLVNGAHVSVVRLAEDRTKTQLRMVGEAQPFLLTVEESYEEVVTTLSRTGTVFAQ